ncbi:MAG: acetaldehyde dehydrogenase (acetylating) [Oscillospiraceae bacterium]|jgi:acetaldehyde dehydrogenase (acetylating)|nr:acetaldehyde dehydrogenase (acetylating) [Oscillospiraceae bacterium]
MDRDLESIQAVRDLIRNAKTAAASLAGFSQAQLDQICAEIAKAGEESAERLAKLAAEETGFGVWQDKILKNLLGSKMTWAYWRDTRVVGVLREDRAAGIIELGVPVGIVAALIPSTNPTSTTLYKAIISLKAGNAVIFSPHPNAKRSILETVALIQQAATRAGAPAGAVQSITLTTMEATNALITSRDTGVILATGGEAMVRAAYSSGNPAIGVGPGNGPAFIEKTADIAKAVRHIIESKTFDNGTICASEQSVVTEHAIARQVEAELQKQGGYFLSEDESTRLSQFLLRPNGTMNPAIVGKPAEKIAAMAGITVPAGTKVLLARQTEVGPQNPYAREKLCPVLAWYEEPGWEAACVRCMELLHNEGVGHTMAIHSNNEGVIREFAAKKPVGRLIVNAPAALGGVGAVTGLAPALTLGCGSVGGSATSDNVGPRHLTNLRRVAWGQTELSDLRPCGAPPPRGDDAKTSAAVQTPDVTPAQIAEITRKVLERLGR